MDTTVEHGTSSAETLTVSYLTPELFDFYWPQINEALDEQPELWEEMFSKESIYDRIHNTEIQAWVVFNGAVIRLIFFTQRFVAPNGVATLQIFWMHGTGLKEIMHLLDDAIDKFAAVFNCSRLEVVGRKGFERLLAPLGAKYQCSIYSRPVRTRRGN